MTLVARDEAGNEAAFPRRVTLDTTPPRVELEEPEWPRNHRVPAPFATRTHEGDVPGTRKPIDVTTKEASWRLRGRVVDEFAAGATIDGVASDDPAGERFDRVIELEIGRNRVEIVARDRVGNESIHALDFVREPRALTNLDLQVLGADGSEVFDWTGIESDGPGYDCTIPTSDPAGPAQPTSMRLRIPDRPSVFLRSPSEDVTVEPADADGWFACEVRAHVESLELEALVKDLEGIDRSASTLTFRLRAPSRPEGFEAAPGARVNANQRLERIRHPKTGTELVLIDTELSDPPALGLAPYYLGKTEVSFGELGAWGQGPRAKPAWLEVDDDWKAHPAAKLNWGFVEEWCATFGGRLPTPAEWDHAAHGGTRPIPWGEFWEQGACHAGDPLSRKENTSKACGSFPTDVSWCGALDMAGSVREMCLSGGQRFVRGGSYVDDPRNAPPPTTSRSRVLGFRVALDAPPRS